MANIASVVNGEIAANKASTDKKSNNSSLDKDAFLQLLVTQMKYQDPLEPTDNTEYVSQLATFSELEEMQNLGASSDLQRATSLVGQYVTVNVTSETGAKSITGGQVDYVVVENGKAFLNINGSNYSIDDLDSVVDAEYLTAYNLATDFGNSMSKLPSLTDLTTAYEDVITNLRAVYDDMSSYQKQFISNEQLSILEKYEEKLKELKLAIDS